MEAIKAKVAGLTVAQLQEMASLLMNDYREGADLIFQVVLNALETRMASADFVAFSETL
jgi:hypothetical protein